MQGFAQESHLWHPLTVFGIYHPFFYLNSTIIINTWLVLVIILLVSFLCRFFLTKKKSVIRYLAISYVETFTSLVEETMGKMPYNHFVFVTTIFTFILLCNCIIVIPGTEEPTHDYNTAFALSLVAFLYKEFYTIKVHGFWSYISEFFHPFFVMFPLNVIGHISKIISMSFRLFGNIFGGSMIMSLYTGAIGSSVYTQLLGLFSGINLGVLLFFGIFEGFIQAFVFATLALTYLAIAIRQED